MNATLEKLKLHNGIEIPLYGLDTIGFKENELKSLIKEAMENGIVHIETAAEYNTETAIGEAIAECGIARKDLFLTDEDYETGIWFEEGMVEYISSRYFLTDEEFTAAKDAARQLTALFRAKHGWHSLEDFGQKTYEGDYASIFYEYQRSLLAIDALVQRLGSVEAVFAEYKKWHDHPVDLPLTEWFRIDL